jgi:hypothetical protein
MTRTTALIACLAALALAGCESGGEGESAPASSTESAGTPAQTQAPSSALPTPQTGGATPAPAPGAAPAPREVNEDEIRDIYVALDAGVTPTAVIFAIDQNRNGNPSDERAIRLSPENNQCNPQELTSYNFPAGSRPVFSIEEARRGVTPVELPRFLAANVTAAMVQGGLAQTPEDTLPQNVCTRKLWEVLVQNQQARTAAAGQQ